jgi:hypothetical protein
LAANPPGFAASLSVSIQAVRKHGMLHRGGKSHLGIFTKDHAMNTESILLHLKKHGQLLDADIAKGTGIALNDVRTSLLELSAQKAISMCSMTVFKNGTPIEGMFCRVAGYMPSAAPGRKPGVKT